jgi:predicted DNA-binding transcriptional regulator YafY
MAAIEIDYTNHRGERRIRHVLPLGIEHRAAPPWHPEEQWLMLAFDVERDEPARWFAMSGIHSWKAHKHEPVHEAG